MSFFIPHHLLSSGIGGVAIMFYFAVGLPVGVGIFALNIPIMIACYKFMGRQYTILSIVGTAIFSVLADATAFLSTWDIVKDPMISSITGGLVSGLGFGIFIQIQRQQRRPGRRRSIVKKYYSLEMGNVVMVINSLILVAAAYMFSLEMAVLTFVSTYITASSPTR